MNVLEMKVFGGWKVKCGMCGQLVNKVRGDNGLCWRCHERRVAERKAARRLKQEEGE